MLVEKNKLIRLSFFSRTTTTVLQPVAGTLSVATTRPLGWWRVTKRKHCRQCGGAERFRRRLKNVTASVQSQLRNKLWFTTTCMIWWLPSFVIILFFLFRFWERRGFKLNPNVPENSGIRKGLQIQFCWKLYLRIHYTHGKRLTDIIFTYDKVLLKTLEISFG